MTVWEIFSVLHCLALLAVLLALLLAGPAFAADLPAALAGKINAATWNKVADGELRELIVVYRDTAVESEAAVERSRRRVAFADQAILGLRATRYREIKDRAHAVMAAREFEVRKDYSHVPASFMRFENATALRRLLLSSEVVAVVEDIRVFPTLAESLPLIRQPAVAKVSLAQFAFLLSLDRCLHERRGGQCKDADNRHCDDQFDQREAVTVPESHRQFRRIVCDAPAFCRAPPPSTVALAILTAVSPLAPGNARKRRLA